MSFSEDLVSQKVFKRSCMRVDMILYTNKWKF